MAGPLVEGYGFKVIVRFGLAANVPTLQQAEMGYDTDQKVLRVGDDTPTPPRIPTTKSLGNFDFTTSGAWKFSQIDMAENGTIDGVDISKLNAASGIMIRKANNDFGHVSVGSGDSSLQVTNGNGVNGNLDIRIHPSIMTLINGGFLQRVYTSAVMTGTGRQESPLDIRAASTTLTGVSRFATNAEAGAGSLTNVKLSPSNLLNLAPDSAVFLYLKGLFQTNLSLSHDSTLSGAGNPSSPLSVVQATTTQRGGAVIATQVDVNAGSDAQKYLTPATLKGLAQGSPTAVALAIALGIQFPINITDVRMGAGPGLLGNPTGIGNAVPQVLLYATHEIVTAGITGTEMRPINVQTLSYFFPYYAVKTVYAPTANLPAPALVGQGALAVDTQRGMVYSDGSQWLPVLGPSQGIWKTISQVTLNANSTVALGLQPKRRYIIHGGTLTAAVSAFQAFIGGVWTTINLTYAGTFPKEITVSSELISPWAWGAFCTDGSSFIRLYPAIHSGHGLLLPIAIPVGAWNGNIRATINNLAIETLEPF